MLEVDSDTEAHFDKEFQCFLNNNNNNNNNVNKCDDECNKSIDLKSKSNEKTFFYDSSNFDDDNVISFNLVKNNLLQSNCVKMSLTMEDIELNSLKYEDNFGELDIDSIEKDAELHCENNSSSVMIPVKCNKIFNHDKSTAYSYTPERLIRNQDYRILTPSPTLFTEQQSPSTPQMILNNNNNKLTDKFTKKTLENLIDSSKFGARHLEALLDQRAAEIRVPVSLRHRKYLKNKLIKKNYEDYRYLESLEGISIRDPLEIANCETPSDIEISDLESSCSSNNEPTIKNQSINNQSPICLSDELATASSVYTSIDSHQTKIAFNEVVEILESLDSNPDEADKLIEDRFCSGHSEHDRLTRLALSIEQEDEPYVTIKQKNSEDDFNQLRGRVEKLQTNTKGIFADIRVLRRDFQIEDKKIELLEIETSNVRHEIQELRYLDDLLNLLRGELERISRRNWPFIIGHSDNQSDEINLVV